MVVVSKEIGLEGNADKTKYTIMSRDQNAERRHNIKIGNSFFERVGQSQYLGTTLNPTEEEIKSRLKSANACYYSVQNLLSYSLLSKNIN
jgi:hypothetical protein